MDFPPPAFSRQPAEGRTRAKVEGAEQGGPGGGKEGGEGNGEGVRAWAHACVYKAFDLRMPPARLNGVGHPRRESFGMGVPRGALMHWCS